MVKAVVVVVVAVVVMILVVMVVVAVQVRVETERLFGAMFVLMFELLKLLVHLESLLSGRRCRQLVVVEAHEEAFVRVAADHVAQQVLAIAAEIVVLVVAVVYLSEAVHVHLAHKRYGLLSVELVVGGLQIVGLEFVAVQVDALAVLRPTKAVLNTGIVYQLPEFLWKQLLVLVHQEAARVEL